MPVPVRKGTLGAFFSREIHADLPHVGSSPLHYWFVFRGKHVPDLQLSFSHKSSLQERGTFIILSYLVCGV